MIRKYKPLDGWTIVFDLDGTLVDSRLDLVPALNRTIAHFGLPEIEDSQVGYLVGRGVMPMLQRAVELHGESPSESDMKAMFSHYLLDYEAHVADKTIYFDGCLEALDHLMEKGATLAVCTNKFENLARKLLSLLGEIERYAAITGGDTFEFRKPDGRHIAETVRLAGGSLDKAIMVGDSISDIDAAKDAGIPVIGVTFGYTDVPVRELGPDEVITDFEDLPSSVQRLTESAIQGFGSEMK